MQLSHEVALQARAFASRAAVFQADTEKSDKRDVMSIPLFERRCP